MSDVEGRVERPLRVEHRMMREVNRSLVLGVLRDERAVSRVELARRTGLSKPTISDIVDALVDEGLVIDMRSGGSTGRAGRPPALLAFNDRAQAHLGIQFGVHLTQVAVADGRGRVLIRETIPAEVGRPESSIAQAVDTARRLLRRCRTSLSRVVGAGVALPGLIETGTGICRLAPNLMWTDIPIRRVLEDNFGAPVTVVNTTAAAALAESRHGAARGHSSFLWVYAGTGIGAAIISDGRIYTGAAGFSGEIGHCPIDADGPLCSCGNRGCLETMAGSRYLEREARRVVERGVPTLLAAGRESIDMETVTGAAAAGDSEAQRILALAGGHLGRGLAILLNLLNPGLVVVGGGLARSAPGYVEAARAGAARHALAAGAVPVVMTALGADAPLMGALELAAAPATVRLPEALSLG